MSSAALALAGTPLFVLAAVLAGVWLGFRICTRDAALLARFAVDAREARATAERIESAMEATLENVERKRASAAAAASRAEAKLREAAVPEEAEPLTARDRRRAIARRLNGAAA